MALSFLHSSVRKYCLAGRVFAYCSCLHRSGTSWHHGSRYFGLSANVTHTQTHTRIYPACYFWIFFLPPQEMFENRTSAVPPDPRHTTPQSHRRHASM